jgi:glycosyltransferase involved in cell wall biosynthesis
MPEVSVVTVFHRDTPFLRPALASVLGQTFRDFEFVLVDNGTGLSAADLGEPGRDPRLRFVRLPRNEGIPAGHNAGVAAAQGEFVALLDYDDLALPSRLERQVAALRADPGLGLVSALATRIDENDRASGTVFCLPDAAEHRAYAPYAAPVITPVAMARRELLCAYPYRAEFPFAADLDFQARVADRTRMAVLPEVLLRYRWYSAQTTHQRAAAIEQSRCAIQILAGRRRVGRPEEIPGLLAAIAAPTAAETWRRGAALCVAEGFGLFAAFQARRSFALERTPAGAWRAARLALNAWHRAREGDRARVARMFFTGPVRALRLHPAS